MPLNFGVVVKESRSIPPSAEVGRLSNRTHDEFALSILEFEGEGKCKFQVHRQVDSHSLNDADIWPLRKFSDYPRNMYYISLFDQI